MRQRSAIALVAAVFAVAAIVVACPKDGPPPVADVVVTLDDGTTCGPHDFQPDAGPCSFDFGVVDVDVDGGAAHTFTLTNKGTGDAVINPVELFGDSSFSVASQDEAVAAGGTGALVIAARPSVITRVSTSMSVSWEPPENIIRLSLFSGTADVPKLRFDPLACVPEAQAPGAAVICDFNIVNDGTADLVISGGDVLGTGFSIQNDLTQIPPIPPQGVQSIGFRGTAPDPPGFETADVVIASNDPANPKAAFHVAVTSCVGEGAGCREGSNDCCQTDDTTDPLTECLSPNAGLTDAGPPLPAVCTTPPSAGEGEGEGE